TWLPDAHVEAPTAGSVMLAGVLLKMGGYGLLRLCVTLLPQSAQDWQWLLIALAVINAIYGAFVALAQTDLKKMIANSSISHMGYVILGIAALTQVGFHGALLVMLAHGLYSGLLFSMVGLVYDRTHTREVGAMGGLAARMPFIATVFMIAGLASLGLPGLAGFVAEFTTFIGAYSVFPLATILCVCTIAITAGYILWRLGSVFYGPLMAEWSTLTDAIWRERLSVGILAAAMLLVGVLPIVVTDFSAADVDLLPRTDHRARRVWRAVRRRLCRPDRVWRFPRPGRLRAVLPVAVPDSRRPGAAVGHDVCRPSRTVRSRVLHHGPVQHGR